MPDTLSDARTDASSATLPVGVARAAVRLATASGADERRESLEAAAKAVGSHAVLVLYRSVPPRDEARGGTGCFEVLERIGGPIGAPTRVPWGAWGPADAARLGLEHRGRGPHPFGPTRWACLAGPAARSGEGLGLAILLPDSEPDRELNACAGLLAEAARLAEERSGRMQRLAARSLRDPLTGALNRKALDEVLVREMKRASRPSNVKQTSLLMIDLDGFKEVNDRWGHAAGDAVLRAVTDAVRQVVRIEDVLARYGGDEFVLLLPETPREGSLRVAGKVRDRITALEVPFGEAVLRVGLSVGASTDPGEAATFDHVPTEEELRALARRFADRIRRLLQSADEALYRAKALGKGAVCHSDGLSTGM